nr:serine/threonine protein kinase [Acidobacteriota bacterium]
MIGTTVSHYEILERLGGGGSGVVYKARDRKLERFVALKFLSPHRAGGEAERRRFLREARAASALDHPNICTVYEVGEAEDGGLFIAMAWSQSEPLKAVIERGPMPLALAVELAAQVAAGLQRAHGLGIVHRDIKPANVIVTAEGQAKIVDFGIAWLADQTRLTRSGHILGTTAYLSPELFHGEAAGPRADLWALGVVLYEMIAASRPFTGATDSELIASILRREPRPLATLRAGVPAELQRVVDRALAKRPERRYP